MSIQAGELGPARPPLPEIFRGEGAPPQSKLGVLDCPTKALPPYTPGVDMGLSGAYRHACAGCHGSSGTSANPRYPSIPGTLSFDAFRDAVRTGTGSMPSYGTDYVDDTTLRADYDQLKVFQAEAQAVAGTRVDEWSWSEARLKEAYERGMEAWRKPDAKGMSCADCHGPDGLDLAVIGYADDAMLRRAIAHVSPQDAAAIVDFVHAQRRYFNIGEVCETDWRVLQPGGQPLPGETPEARDESFATMLNERGYRLATGAVAKLEDAEAVLEEMATLDIRRLPLGIGLPRWSEDAFNGEAHRSIDDYMSAVGRAPRDPEQWHARMDSYLMAPGEGELGSLIYDYFEATDDGGFAARARDAVPTASGRCGRAIEDYGSVLTLIDETKFLSLMLVQHYMRMELLDLPGWFDEPSVPMQGYATKHGEALNPFYRLGAHFAEHDCRNVGDMWNTWPETALAEISTGDLEQNEALGLARSLNHTWQSLGVLYDPALWMSEDYASPHDLHYWVLDGFVEAEAHIPFLYAHRALLQQWLATRGDEAPAIPRDTSAFSRVRTEPIVDGEHLYFATGLARALGSSDPRASTANSLRCNAIRTMLHLQHRAFSEGVPGNRIFTPANLRFSLEDHWKTWTRFANSLENVIEEDDVLNEVLSAQPDLCTSELRSLIDNVRDLASSATDLIDS